MEDSIMVSMADVASEADFGGPAWRSGSVWVQSPRLRITTLPPTFYYSPPQTYYQPPPQGYSQAQGGGGQSCYAGAYVCPMDRPVATGANCYCPGNNGQRVPGRAN